MSGGDICLDATACLDAIDIKILAHLIANGAQSFLTAETARTITEKQKIGLGLTSVRRRARSLKGLGVIAEGIKKGQEKSYYITKEGKKRMVSMAQADAKAKK